jgi:hypothetical protein
MHGHDESPPDPADRAGSNAIAVHPWNGARRLMASSSEVGVPGSREENASKQEAEAGSDSIRAEQA